MMTWQFNPYAIPLLLSSIVLVAFAIIARQRHASRAVNLFLLVLFSVAGLNFAYGLELLSATLPQIMLWVKVEYAFLFLPVLWFLFIIAFTGNERWLTRRNIALTFVIPIFWTFLAWTNELHGLNWATTGTEVINGQVLFSRTYGAGFYVGVGYLYLMTVAAAGLMIISIIRSPAVYRGQIRLLLLGVALPLLGSVLTITGLTPVPNLDLMPFGYALACIPVGWSLFRQKLFDLVPMAHSQVIQSMSDAVLVLDNAQRVVNANIAAEQIATRTMDELIGKTLAAVFPKQYEALQKLLDNSQTRLEIPLKVTGATRYYEPRLSPLNDNQGQLRGWILVLRDITERKEAAETIRAYNSELESRNRELDAFSHTVAHDLKSPITNIIGYSQLLLSLNNAVWNQELGSKHLATIQESGHKMSQMVDSLLTLSNIRDAQAMLIPVDMTAAANAAVERFRLEINRKGIDVTVGDLPSVPGEKVWLEEVFANLISNAIKYMGRANRSPRIAIQGYALGDYVRYEVQDNGMGVNPQDQQKLFEMFSRFHQAEATGLGLGLSIVLRIVTKLDGKTGVQSRPDGGSTFWFMIPTNTSTAPEPVDTQSDGIPATASP